MAGPPRSLAKRLGLHSYRGRYLWLVAVFGLLLACAAYVGKSMVRETARNNTIRSRESARLLDAAGDASRELDNFTSRLLNFSIDPEHTTATNVRNGRQVLDIALQRLSRRLGQNTLAPLPDLQQAMLQDRRELRSKVETLIKIRQATNQWVPASRMLTQVMDPLGQAINTRLQNLQSMLDDSRADHAARLSITDFQIPWLRLVGEVRLLVANRFGAFGANIDQALTSRNINISNLTQVANRALAALSGQLKKTGDPLLLGEYRQLHNAVYGWEAALSKLNSLMGNANWRRDTYFLHHDVEPVIQRLQQRIGAVRVMAQSEAQRQLDSAMQDSHMLADGTVGVAGSVILLLLLGYLTFEHWLLRPIEHIARQLRNEAMGQAPNPLALSMVAETRTLVEAFDQMHEQVRSRQLRLDHMAHHDPLTGLPNRVLFRQRLETALAHPVAQGHSIAVLFLDLDRFKQVNDSHGHLVGDKLLIEVAQRLRAIFREEDTVARLSGDEFAVLLNPVDCNEEPIKLARKVIMALEPAFTINGATYHSSASIGLTIAPRDGTDADQLIQHADAAMYHAKAAGRGRYSAFSRAMIEQTSAQLALENELRAAVLQQELEVYLQPVVQLDDAETHAYECLLRWQHPIRGTLLPGEFLATLEDIGLLLRITDWILDRLTQSGITTRHSVSINLPAKLLRNRGFADNLEQRVRKDIYARHLIVEITEDSLSGEVARAAHLLHRLHNRGVRIALDDFGTGQASLSHLRAFPFDLVKIDRSFIRDLEHKPDDLRLVRAMVDLMTTLGIAVVAEGVENTQQRELLTQFGCLYGQGYLFGAPAPMQEIWSESDISQRASDG